MHYAWATPFLGPLLLLQGNRVRKRVPILPEPPGPRSGAAGNGVTVRVLLVGDSSAAGVGSPTQQAALSGQLVGILSQYCRIEWQLLAKTGATTESSVRALHKLPSGKVDVAVTVLGVNDVTSVTGASKWLTNQTELRNTLRSRFDTGHIVVCGLPPISGFPALPQPLRWYLGSKARRLSELLQRSVANDDGVRYFPVDFCQDATLMASDGFHPGPVIYAEWGKRLAAAILALKNIDSN